MTAADAPWWEPLASTAHTERTPDMPEIDLDAIRAEYDAHRAELPTINGADVHCCHGCLTAERIPTLVAEVERLKAQLTEVRRDAFGRGVEAAAAAIEQHAESIGWYEAGGVWAEAIERARTAADAKADTDA